MNCDLQNVECIAQTFFTAIEHRQYHAVAALLLIGVVWLIRRYSSKVHGKLGEVLNSDRGGALLSLAIGQIGAVATALLAHKAVSLDLVMSGLVTAVAGSGALNVYKRVTKPADGAAATPPAASIALFLIFSTVLSGCAYMKAVGVNLKECALGKVPASVGGAVMDEVKNVLRSENANWEDSLKSVGVRVGLDALSCALKAIVDPLIGKKMSLDPAGQRMLERGQIYLNRLGV